MHPSKAFRTGDDAALMDEAASIGFARIFASTPSGPRVAHAPMLRVGDRFRFHLANANALCAMLDGTRTLALFEGSNGYLSANWYADVASGADLELRRDRVRIVTRYERSGRSAMAAVVREV